MGELRTSWIWIITQLPIVWCAILPRPSIWVHSVLLVHPRILPIGAGRRSKYSRFAIDSGREGVKCIKVIDRVLPLETPLCWHENIALSFAA